MLNTSHIPLHSFYSNHFKKEEIKKIFHYFAEAKVIVYIGNSKYFSTEEIDNNNTFYKLTLDEIESIFM